MEKPIVSQPLIFIFTKGDAPTLTILELMDMEGADGKNLRIIPRIAAGDYVMFGIRLLQDENGDQVELVKRDHRQDGTESVIQAIIRKWLTSGAAPTQYLIECLRKSGLGALAKDIANAIACEGNNYYNYYNKINYDNTDNANLQVECK